MKKLFFVIVICVLSLSSVYSLSNEKEEIQTLFRGGEEISYSFYAGPQIKLTRVNDELDIFLGARGGWTINKTFTIGLAGYGNVMRPAVSYMNATDTINTNFMFGYGGIYLEYIYRPTAIIHFSTNTLFAFGGSGLWHGNSMMFGDYDDRYQYENNPWTAYFIVEPTVAIHLNVTKFFRIAFEASYRITNEIRRSSNYQDIIYDGNELNMNGFSTGFTLEFGLF